MGENGSDESSVRYSPSESLLYSFSSDDSEFEGNPEGNSVLRSPVHATLPDSQMTTAGPFSDHSFRSPTLASPIPISESEAGTHKRTSKSHKTFRRDRKTAKQMTERKRRDRINGLLETLRGLILRLLNKNPRHHRKLEKADILELVVSYLKRDLHRKRPHPASKSDQVGTARAVNSLVSCDCQIKSVREDTENRYPYESIHPVIQDPCGRICQSTMNTMPLQSTGIHYNYRPQTLLMPATRRAFTNLQNIEHPGLHQPISMDNFQSNLSVPTGFVPQCKPMYKEEFGSNRIHPWNPAVRIPSTLQPTTTSTNDEITSSLLWRPYV